MEHLEASAKTSATVRPLTEFYQVWKDVGLLSALWLDRTLRRGYALQFSLKPPPFGGVLSTKPHSPDDNVALLDEVYSLLQRGTIMEVEPSRATRDFYSPYFPVPKKSGGARLF